MPAPNFLPRLFELWNLELSSLNTQDGRQEELGCKYSFQFLMALTDENEFSNCVMKPCRMCGSRPGFNKNVRGSNYEFKDRFHGIVVVEILGYVLGKGLESERPMSYLMDAGLLVVHTYRDLHIQSLVVR